MSLYILGDGEGIGLYAAGGIGVVFAAIVYVLGRLILARRGPRYFVFVRSRAKSGQGRKSNSLDYGMEMGRRKAVRCSGGRAEVLVAVKGQTSATTGHLLDYSRIGIGVAVAAEVAVGSILRVQMPAKEDDDSGEVREASSGDSSTDHVNGVNHNILLGTDDLSGNNPNEANHSNPDDRWIEVEVKRCVDHETEWHLGCAIVSEPATEAVRG